MFRHILLPTDGSHLSEAAIQKGIQLALSNQKVRYTDFNGFNYGFVRDYGVRKALARSLQLRTKNQFVYKTDISSFFDNIERPILKQEIQNKTREIIANIAKFRLAANQIAANVDANQAPATNAAESDILENLTSRFFNKNLR